MDFIHVIQLTFYIFLEWIKSNSCSPKETFDVWLEVNIISALLYFQPNNQLSLLNERMLFSGQQK